MSAPLRPIRRLLLLGSLPTWLGACTMVGAVEPTPAPPRSLPSPDAPAPSPPVVEDAVPPADGAGADGIAAGVVEVALESIGTPYEWGGTDANGFDCSGLIQYAYGQFGIRLPRVSTQQIRSGSPVEAEPSLLRPGDVLGFSESGAPGTSHVGLYVGDDDFIHSSTTGVRVSSLRDPYWRRRLVAARRFVE